MRTVTFSAFLMAGVGVAGCVGSANPVADQNLLTVSNGEPSAPTLLPRFNLQQDNKPIVTREKIVANNGNQARRLPDPQVPPSVQQAVPNRFSVLAYHRVGYDDSPYTITPESFDTQMHFLFASGYKTLTLQDIRDFYASNTDLPARSVLITIDDGHRSAHTEVHRILGVYGFRAVYFPYSDFINNGGLSISLMKEMLESGRAEFGLHSKTHADLTKVGAFESTESYRERLLQELRESADRIRSIIGVEADALAYPYGKVNNVVEEMVRSEGVNFAFTVNCALNSRKSNPLRLNRCTVQKTDTLGLFQAKLVRPAVALAMLGSSEPKSKPPEFLGHLADREFARGVPIQPFSGYFVDPEGDRVRYTVSSLPIGLKIDRVTGIVSGVPLTATQIQGATIRAIDETGAVSRSNRFSMVVY